MSVGGFGNGGNGMVIDGLIFSIDAYNPKSNQSVVNNLKSGVSTGGTLTNGTTTDNISWSLDGTNDYINFGSISEINTIDYDTPMSVDSWVYWNGDTQTTWIVGNGGVDDLDPGSSGFALIMSLTGRVTFFQRQDATPPSNILRNAASVNSINSGVWAHVAATYDGSNDANGISTYINGVSQSTTIDSNNTLTAMTTTNPLLVGCGAGQAGVGVFPLTERHFDGDVSVINIYKNKVLNPTEVKQNYNALKGRYLNWVAPIVAPTINLISDWNPNNDVYTDAGSTLATDTQTVQEWHDQSTNNIIANQTIVNSKPTYHISGGTISKPYLQFDGGDDWLEVIGSEALYGDEDITIYIVAELDTATNYDTFFQKGEDWNWDSGWMVSVDAAGRSTATIFEWTENYYTGTVGGTTGAAEVRGMRFRTSSAPFISNLRVDGGADTEITLHASHNTNDAPNHNAIIGAAWDATGTGPDSYVLDGKIYRILIYDGYHDDTTYSNTITTLMSEYS